MSTEVRSRVVPDSYFDRVRAFPLRPIRSEDELEWAVAVLVKLSTSTPRRRWTWESGIISRLSRCWSSDLNRDMGVPYTKNAVLIDDYVCARFCHSLMLPIDYTLLPWNETRRKHRQMPIAE